MTEGARENQRKPRDAGAQATAEPRPRRSVLYLPGANERALEKAKTLAADALILDLEDAVAPDAKEGARERVCAAAASGGYGSREVTIRVNGIDAEWHDADLRAAAQAGPAAVVVPKVNSSRDVHNIERALELSGAPDRTKIWAMIETPVAMLHAEDIAGASERLTVLVMGTNDLAKELHAEFVPGRAPLLGGLSLALLAARATGKVILDGVYNDLKDLEGFEAECLQGRQWGFDGKTLIHPGQLDACNRVFAPAAEEIEKSQKIIAAFTEARAKGLGVATVDGRLIENLHVDNARRILALAEAIEKTAE
jgi:citrate lyase subunit beta/citryl-CoA lyase